MPRKIRICYVINRFMVGGAETVALDLARRLDPARYEVAVVAALEPPADREPEMRRRFREAGVRTRVHHFASFHDPRAVLQLYTFLLAGRFDIVHGHSRFADAWGCRVGAWAGIPHRLWTRHLVYRDMNARQIRRYQNLARRAPFVVAVSDTVRDACLEIEGLPAEKVITVVNGIDTGRYAPLEAADRRAARGELGVHDDEFLLVFVAKMEDQKAPQAFPRVVQELRRRGLPVRGFMCGRGALEDEVRALAASLGDSTTLLGVRGDVPQLLGAADLMVSTSRNEGLPLNVMETMSAGTPFAAPDIGQISCLVETCPDGARRLLPAPPLAGDVPPAIIGRWADSIAALLADPLLRARMGREGRRIIREQYSLDRMVGRHDELYRSLSARR